LFAFSSLSFVSMLEFYLISCILWSMNNAIIAILQAQARALLRPMAWVTAFLNQLGKNLIYSINSLEKPPCKKTAYLLTSGDPSPNPSHWARRVLRAKRGDLPFM